MAARIERVFQLSRLGELHQTLLQVGERTLHKAPVFFVVVEQVVPEGLLGQHPGVAHHDHSVLGAGQRHVQPPGIGQKTDALVQGG